MVKPVWADFVSGSLTTTIPATNAGQTQMMTSDGLKRLPSVIQGQTQAKVTIDPFAQQGLPELVYVVSHAANTNTALVQFIAGQPLREHIAAEQWVHGPTAEDFNEFQGQLDNQLHASVFTAAGQLLGSTAPATPAAVPLGVQYQSLTVDTAQPTKLRYRGVPIIVTSTTRPTLASGAYEGMTIYETDSNHMLVNINPSFNGGAGQWVYVDDPPGTVASFAGGGAPAGWLWCDGSGYDGTQAQFIALYAVIGQQFGGSGNVFHVPDLRDRFVFGWNPTVSGDQNTQNALGFKYGQNTWQLTVGQLPGHMHGIPNHAHSMVHGHTAQNGTENLGQQTPYPILAFREDGSPQKLYSHGDGLAVSFSWLDNFNGNTGGAGAGQTGPGAGTNNDIIDSTPASIRLGYMIRR